MNRGEEVSAGKIEGVEGNVRFSVDAKIFSGRDLNRQGEK